MFNILQPGSLIPYRNERKKIEVVKTPAIVIPINAKAKTPSPANKKLQEEPILPEQWKMPEQEEGYIRGNRFDFL